MAMEFFGIVPMVVLSFPDDVLLFPLPLLTVADIAVFVFRVTIAFAFALEVF